MSQAGGAETECVGLICAALPHAPKVWWKSKDLRGPLRAAALRIRQGSTLRRRLEIARREAAHMAALIKVSRAKEGAEGMLLDAQALRSAITHDRDVMVWPRGEHAPVRVTPHAIIRRGREEVLEGHISQGGSERAYPLDRAYFAWGPHTDRSDRLRREGSPLPG